MIPRIVLTLLISNILILSARNGPCLTFGSQMSEPGDAPTTGIATDGMSRSRARTWRSIVELIMAKDSRDQFLYPTLHSLYQQAAMSGHLTRIELSEEESLTRAGTFVIEKADPGNSHHEVKIRLNLATIRRAHMGNDERYGNGLIPFAGLTKKQRYAEVLGHELAHAIAAFQNPELMRLQQQLDQETLELDVRNRNSRGSDLFLRLDRIRQLQRKIEEPAEAAELKIWAELSRRK